MTILASWDDAIAAGVRAAVRRAVVVVEHLDELRALLARQPRAAVLLDARVGGSGCRAIEEVPELRALDPRGLVVLLSRSATEAEHVEARALGCAALVCCPNDLGELALALAVLRAAALVRARRRWVA